MNSNAEKIKDGEELGKKTPQKLEEKIDISQEADEDSIKSSQKEAKDHRDAREQKVERAGIAYIFSSQNNTIIHITDLAGNTISRISGGMVTKHSRLKADPTVAMFAAKRAAERARDFGINALYIRTRAKTGSPGIGSGAHAALKSLSKEGFRIISILDTSRVARGGPKKKGGKRGRRV